MTAILTAKNIKKTYQNPKPINVLDGVDLTVFPGQSVAICGRSGEGKSTLLQILGTLESPTHGSLAIAGKELSSLNKSQIRNQSIGYIYQAFHLLDDFTVLDNILMPALIARETVSPGSTARKRADTLLEQVGLTSRAHHLAKQLSGGEKQRVAIARALCNNPPLILADEPTGNLDSTTAKAIHELLINLVQENGKTLILVTHDKALANLCDKTYHLSQGQLLE